MRCWDLASSAKQRNKVDPDYSVGIRGGVKKNAKGQHEIWISDILRGQWEAPQRDAVIQQAAMDDGGAVPVLCECFGPYKDTYTTLKKILWGKRSVRKSQIRGDKQVKSAPLEAIFEAGNFYMSDAIDIKIQGALKNEFAQSPYGKHDDIVDAISILYNESVKSKATLLIY